MIGRTFFEEDQALKRFAAEPPERKPSFDWGPETAPEQAGANNRLFVENGSEHRNLKPAEIAGLVGSALTDLLLSRNEKEIFTDQNRSLVSDVSKSVVQQLLGRNATNGDGKIILNEYELTHVIERALEKHQEWDVARSVVARQRARLNGGMNLKVTGNGSSPKPLIRVLRRNGDLVAWNTAKIEIAVRKAFLALHMDSEPAVAISEGLARLMTESNSETIHIEELQDRVQEELMSQRHFKVAEAYILYRSHRSLVREAEVAAAAAAADDPAQDSMVLVTRPNGETYLWDGLDLRKRIDFAAIGLELCIGQDEIERELRRSVNSEMTEEGLKSTILLNAKTLIEKDADFARFAGRLHVSYIYEEVLGWNIMRDGIQQLPDFHRRAFKANLHRAVEIERINPKLEELDLDELAKAIDPVADLDFDYLGIDTLYSRYLIVDKTSEQHRRLETPQLFWMRVAMGIFSEEENPTKRIIDLYRLYKSRRFCSSTPTLFNSGTLHSQLSSCYLYKVDDSIESIMSRGIAENAYLSKWAGGLGGSWTAVRGTGSYIKGTNGESQGVIPFLKLHNDQLVAVNQGGKRKGSGCAYLETWHNDIFQFFELRKNTGDDRRRTHDMNTANWIPDLFMKRMEARESWTLFRSNEVPDLHELYGRKFEARYVEYEEMARRGEISGEVVQAIEVWKGMLRMLFETGHPWITFKDPCNVRSPQDHVGVIHSSNLCTEITLNTGEDETAVCNLGSVVLDQHVDEEGNINHDKLRETIRIAVRALDNVIDINFYPTEPAKNANQRHRPIGMGVMGLQNALFKRNVPFASPDAIEFNDEMMEAVAFYAYEASSDLAAEKGTYQSYPGSKWDRGLLPQDTIDLLEEERGLKIDVPRGGKLDWTPIREKIAKQGMRNSNVLAIAPTATISNIMGSTPCIEPLYKNLYTKSNLGGEFVTLNPYLVRDLKAVGLWGKETRDRIKYHDGELAEINRIPDDIKRKYVTAFGIPHDYFIEAAARRQKWIDQSQSVNLFLAEPSMKTLSHLYRSAWRKGLKTTYYLRTLAASAIEKATVSDEKEMRSVVADSATEQATADALATEVTPRAATACELDALINGTECESCQ
ncbi:MAG: ribonucleoside-diphosphate reductase alpha chain [Verrucomicrobiales bacterium]|jgi:ribonucleoside-diphosphate reductase alpha chain